MIFLYDQYITIVYIFIYVCTYYNSIVISNSQYIPTIFPSYHHLCIIIIVDYISHSFLLIPSNPPTVAIRLLYHHYISPLLLLKSTEFLGTSSYSDHIHPFIRYARPQSPPGGAPTQSPATAPEVPAEARKRSPRPAWRSKTRSSGARIRSRSRRQGRHFGGNFIRDVVGIL